MRLVAEALAQRPEHARLADPGLAREQHHLAVAVLGPGPALEQDAELVLAPDQRREMLAVQRLEAALGATLAFDPPGGERLGEALEALRAEVGQLEQPADQPARRLADHHAARRRERLQPRREVRRLADHGLLLGRALADQLADHDQAGRDADPGRQRLARRRRPAAASAVDQRQPGPDRPLGVVLVRLRPAEIGEHAVAHVLGDVAAPALDHLGAGVLIGADHPPMSSGSSRAASSVEPTRSQNSTVSCRRSASAGLGSGLRPRLEALGRRVRRRSRLGQGGNRFEELAPVPDGGDAKVFEIVSRQLGQDLGVNLVLPERLLVALQPQLPQPSRDVHKRPSWGW